MKRVSDFTRIDTTPNPDFPSGQILDATGKYKEDGTVINKNFLQDWYNFFQKCVRDSGIVPNGNFDTATNAQLFDAVRKSINDDSGWIEVTSFKSGCLQGNDLDALTGYGKLRVRRINNIVYITGGFYCNGVGGGFSLPASIKFNPDLNVRMQLIAANLNSTTTTYPFTIDTDGVAEISGGFTEGNYYFNTSFPIDPTI